jgi:hypothetical protein
MCVVCMWCECVCVCENSIQVFCVCEGERGEREGGRKIDREIERGERDRERGERERGSSRKLNSGLF